MIFIPAQDYSFFRFSDNAFSRNQDFVAKTGQAKTTEDKECDNGLPEGALDTVEFPASYTWYPCSSIVDRKSL